MPTYSYRCTKCGHQYEKFQKISDEARPRCPECRCKGEREISGGAGIHFKGSGFYITDYRSDNYKQGAKNEAQSKETKSDSSKSESKSESKSADKSTSTKSDTQGKPKSKT